MSLVDVQFGADTQRDIQSQQQMSFHFWSCQLAEANPKYRWEPERATTFSANGKDDRPKRQVGQHDERNGSDGEKAKEAEGKGEEQTKGADQNGHHSNGEAAADADFMQHVLKVNACILGPKAAGVHLIAVRTKCYGQDEPDTCPIVCIDPDSQRTVSLGYEFVLDSQNEVTFELAEGAGPVWLTGLHQVRVHDPDDDGEADCDDDADEIDEESVDGSVDLNEEDDEDEDDYEDEEEEAARPVAKRVARASKTDQQRPVASPKKRKPAAKRT
ncbi:hypothetical protein BOX15_Mlig018811g1 [Macrostomum lignano]|uniref:Nucleoplasmin core domain-containing protein n=1 Tax=Macrostomum lignano TaxID=282301 RepID=A0A267FDS4_9PLAT|nr:hypothetical protein BOX15_Mlig018811g1 [Macrostomum lignano]